MLQKAKTLRNRAQNYKIWKNELSSEVDFWRRWISKDEIPETWLAEQKDRLDPNFPLQKWVRNLLKTPEGATVQILDVGAGPATTLGKVWPKRIVKITAVDPLADEYNRLLEENNIKVPVPTQRCRGEALLKMLPSNTFDLIYSMNALDHSHNPLKAIRGMVKLVKKGGWVVLEHYINEAEQEDYDGLHQWNFSNHNNKFVIWNKKHHILVEKYLKTPVKIKLEVQPPKNPGDKEKLFVFMQRVGDRMSQQEI